MRLRWRFGIGFFMLAGVLMPARASTVTWVVLPELAVIAVDIFGYETIPTLDGTGKKEVRRTLDTPKVRQVKARTSLPARLPIIAPVALNLIP